ncbi:bifunctional 2-C-methyl-D-erythritol 4-phosphate cytidylyltransferase/2-C-methyl-D-erythritol 2,4-cyclodiphosphate synthase [Palleronia caenipelagi]|uniref:Bifunctional enzyme IspD/IspF n=1 Tax=Palleronia caenipelagi TaxID=2489174 RepID=A0A547PNL7_9RHOB|nr:bifunctional 2-C-methyl-D-erythritol 4-phosphate cytidylyltransferase/2-C-methyl-D-erythritol 2,4-cyclodiphosphate synthase [Palleronia caenipelagi]TRD15720.1 bifunctional 2-C-methyl-D-erythritol 4-phosphate cytidylyltransferase/2-C-methyl-D-erythritol 2,4-cyclodiphosphate synthase [Palleronia caenipelagi]
MSNAAVIVAAGRGMRAGGGVPKQWRDLGGQTVADRTLAAFRSHPRIDRIVVVLSEGDLDRASGWPELIVVTGGATRAASVANGLKALADTGTRNVLIHDVARPLVSPEVIDRVLDALDTHPGAAPALAVTDALWRGDGPRVVATADRSNLWRAQTPQGFHLDKILAAHEVSDGSAADDVEVAVAAGLDVAIVEGEERNLKITTAADFDRAAKLLRTNMDLRVGNGFDVHAFTAGDAVRLCGVDVPHDKALKGHSDADVGLHALTDAIYGALADGDIGQHFPPSDPQWKGAESDIFLRHAVSRATVRGYAIANADVTLICERPKVGPHAEAMRQTVAGILGVAPDRVSVKATTSERLGFAGREEGIAALATVALVAS